MCRLKSSSDLTALIGVRQADLIVYMPDGIVAEPTYNLADWRI